MRKQHLSNAELLASTGMHGMHAGLEEHSGTAGSPGCKRVLSGGSEQLNCFSGALQGEQRACQMALGCRRIGTVGEKAHACFVVVAVTQEADLHMLYDHLRHHGSKAAEFFTQEPSLHACMHAV
jgi:hypothetical protein